MKIFFEWIESQHSDKIPSFGLFLTFKNEKIYYSGDSSTIPRKIHKAFLKDEIDKIYQDLTIESKNTSHLTLEKAKDLIPKAKRKQVIAMHLDQNAKKKIKKKVLK